MATKDQHIDALCCLCVRFMDEIKALTVDEEDVFRAGYSYGESEYWEDENYSAESCYKNFKKEDSDE